MVVLEMSYPRNCSNSVPTDDSTNEDEAKELSDEEAVASQLFVGNCDPASVASAMNQSGNEHVHTWVAEDVPVHDPGEHE
jgi:hypothetical protein